MNKNYLIKLFNLADNVLPKATERLRKNGEAFLASELAHFTGYLETLRDYNLIDMRNNE